MKRERAMGRDRAMKRNNWVLALGLTLCLALVSVVATPRAAWADGYNTLVHFVLGGLGLQVENGGVIWVEDGGAITVASGGTLEMEPGSAALFPDGHYTGTVTANKLVTTDTAQIGGVLTATGGVAGNVTGNVTGTVTGNVTGNLTGNVAGNVVGNLTGNTATITQTASVGGVLTATGGVVGNVTGNVVGNVTGNIVGNTGTFTQTASIGQFLRLTPQTAITVTEGGVFTPTGSYQPIQAAGSVTPTLGNGTAGDVLILYNLSDTNITFEDEDNTVLFGDKVIAQKQSMMLFFNGADWVYIPTATAPAE